MTQLNRTILYFGKTCVLACDGRCKKAWGINNRPREELDPDDPDNFAWLADHELDAAPDNPGTYEGGHAKPAPDEKLESKWCARECERSVVVDPGEDIALRDFSQRYYNRKPHTRVTETADELELPDRFCNGGHREHLDCRRRATLVVTLTADVGKKNPLQWFTCDDHAEGNHTEPILEWFRRHGLLSATGEPPTDGLDFDPQVGHPVIWCEQPGTVLEARGCSTYLISVAGESHVVDYVELSAPVSSPSAHTDEAEVPTS